MWLCFTFEDILTLNFPLVPHAIVFSRVIYKICLYLYLFVSSDIKYHFDISAVKNVMYAYLNKGVKSGLFN